MPDDLIVEAVHRANDPARVRVISTDTAIVYEARRRGCRSTASLDFIGELFPGKSGPAAPPRPAREKPGEVPAQEARELEDMISGLADELDDGPEWPDVGR